MTLLSLFGPARLRLPFFAPADGAADPAPAAGADPAPAAAPAAAADPATAAAPKWWEAADYSEEERTWIAARGLAEDDPTKIIPKLVKGHRNAEQRIGKGNLDQIIEKPGKDTPLTKWLGDNRAALGLPDTADAYTATPPEDWPKDMPWDGAFEAEARKIAFDNGVPPDAHKAYVAAFAAKMQQLDAASVALSEQARTDMMADLQRDFGTQTPAVINNARRAADWMAQQAGMGAEEIERISAVLSEKTGDAGVIRMLNAVGKALGEDKGISMGSGGSLSMTPADARAELARFEGPEGEYGKAFAANDTVKLAQLRPRREQLAKIATGG